AIRDVGLGLLQLLVQRIVSHAQLEPLTALQAVEEFVADRSAFLQASAALGGSADQSRAQTLEGGAFDDTELFVQILTDLVELHLLDGQGTAVALHAVTGKDLDVDDGAFGASRHTQRGVLHVGRLLTEDRAQQLLFRRQLGLAFRRDLADQDVARADFGADVDDTGFVQLVQRSFTDVRDVRGDLLRAELGVTRHTGQFLNVDGGEAVFLNHTLGQADGVFEVEAVPRHERHTHVLTQCQLTHVGGRTVSHDVTTGNLVTLVHQRTLV